jgi:hypothetical protein
MPCLELDQGTEMTAMTAWRCRVGGPCLLTPLLKRACTIRRGALAAASQINKRSTRPRQLYRFISGGIAVDALVFEFMGLAMVGLCVIVLAVPSGRRASRRLSDF